MADKSRKSPRELQQERQDRLADKRHARDSRAFSRARQARFLKVLAETGNVAKACDEIALSRGTAYWKRKHDPLFREAWDNIIEAAADNMEQEAYRRAVTGVDENVYYRDQLLETRKVYSDRLLGLLLAAYRPDRFGNKQTVTHKGTVGLRIVYDEDPDDDGGTDDDLSANLDE